MNKQELIEAYERISSFCGEISVNKAIENLKQLDEPTIYVKNILARLRELPLHDREVWLKAIMGELNKPVVPQFVADWYKKHKNSLEFSIFDYVYQFDRNEESDLKNWFNDINTNPFQTLVNMHQFGYEVEKEKRYTVRIKNIRSGTAFLKYDLVIEKWYFGIFQNSTSTRLYHTKEELEKGGFEWAFSCDGVEVEEVE